MFAVCLGTAAAVPAQSLPPANVHGLPSNDVLAVAEDGDGRLWCATSAGTAHYSDGAWQPVAEPRRADRSPLRKFARSDDGRLIAVRETTDQGLWIFDGRTWQALAGSTMAESATIAEFVIAGPAAAPSVLVRTPDGVLLHFEAGRWQAPTEFAPMPSRGPQALARLQAGFAVASMHGCVTPDGTMLAWSADARLRDRQVMALAAPHPASARQFAWVRTPARLCAVDTSRGAVVAEFARDRAAPDLHLLALPDGGVLEFGEGRALRFDPERHRPIAVDLGELDSGRIRDASVDSLGIAWIATDRGLLEAPGVDRLPFTPPPGHRLTVANLPDDGLVVRSGDRITRTDLPPRSNAALVLPGRLAERRLRLLVEADDTLLLAAGPDGLLAAGGASDPRGTLRQLLPVTVHDLARGPDGSLTILTPDSIGEPAADGTLRHRTPVPRGADSLRVLADGRVVAFGAGTPLYVRATTDGSWTQAVVAGNRRPPTAPQVVDVALDPRSQRVLVATSHGVCEFVDRGLAPRDDLGIPWGEPCLGVAFLHDGTALVATRHAVLVHDGVEADPLDRPAGLPVDDLRPLLGLTVDASGDVFVFGDRGAKRLRVARGASSDLPLGLDVLDLDSHGVHVTLRDRERPGRSRILRWRIADSADPWRQGIARADGIVDTLASPIGGGPFRVEVQARTDSGRWSRSLSSPPIHPPTAGALGLLGIALALGGGAVSVLLIHLVRRRWPLRQHSDRATAQRAEALIRGAQLPILVTDRQGRMLASTPAARSYFAQAGFTRCPTEALHRPEITSARCPALAADQPHPGRHFGMLPHCRSCDLVMTRIPDTTTGLEVTVFHDRGIERSLARMAPGAWRSRVMDQVARQTALDLGDLLATVSGFTELAIRDLPGDSPGLHDLERVLHTAREGRELVQRLTSFERAALATSSSSLAERLRDVEPLLRSVLGSAIQLGWSVSLGSTFLADAEGELEDALVELCSNAREAIQGEGMVRVIGRADISRGIVQLVVADDGCGMSSEVLARAREMFFSTRANHRALGLGLAGVGAYCRRLGGEMSIESSPGGGTRIELLLPTARDPARRPTRRPQALVVTSDRESSELARSSLHQLGYEMRVASCGSDALQEFDAATGCELLMIDLLAPSEERLAVLNHCRERCPGIAVVFLTSYAKAVADRTARSTHECFLRRPWTAQELAEALDTLHSRPTAPLPSLPPTRPDAALSTRVAPNSPATP